MHEDLTLNSITSTVLKQFYLLQQNSCAPSVLILIKGKSESQQFVHSLGEIIPSLAKSTVGKTKKAEMQ